ncbi:MAG: T9SS type A sorting domain-containing protein [Flavobacteriaceae bacterium]|nr:T9SS type A sorting domain-containing protein [Flavobacteriaceae bacterium]
MVKNITSLIFLFISMMTFSQIQNIIEKYELPSNVIETSGLLFLNGKLITHNDSGDGPNIYEIDTISGNITRTIVISNALNIDWEDIAQDNTYIYIGDIGNNNSTRTDLTIYRILKSDIESNSNVTSESITFSYEDQIDFTSLPNNNNFDAEAIAIYNDKIVIFTKNWIDNTVNAYTIEKTIGNHTAIKVSTYNSEGLITGATYNEIDDSFMLSGYTSLLQPFLIFIKNNQPLNDDFFSGTIERTDITSNIGQGSQIEGITTIDQGKYFLSRERFTTVINATPVDLPQKLYRFDNGSFVLSTSHFPLKSLLLYPNPTTAYLQLKHIKSQEIKELQILDVSGKLLMKLTEINKGQISIDNLNSGVYLLKVLFKNNQKMSQKFIKN